MKWCRLVLVLVLVFWAVQTLALEVRLKDQVTVRDDVVRLSDVADLQPDGEEARIWAKRSITQAPSPGEAKILQSSSIISSLRHFDGFPTLRWHGPDRVIIRRAGQEVSKEQLRRIIMDYIHDHLKKFPQAELKLSGFRAPESIVLPTGQLDTSVKPSRPGILGSSSFAILFSQDGRTIKNITIHARLEAVADVVVASSAIRRGSIITAGDVQVVRQDISRLNDPFPEVRMVIGLQATRSIRAGRPLDSSNVAPAPVVKKGQAVKILASRGSLVISTRGVAIMDGRPGEFIRVKNISSNKLVYCRVDGPGIVSVEF